MDLVRRSETFIPVALETLISGLLLSPPWTVWYDVIPIARSIVGDFRPLQ